MTLADLIGFIGVSLILIAYLLNLWDYLESENITYIMMNLIGAALACISSMMIRYVPFILLEGVWTLSSLIAAINYFSKTKKIKN